MSDYFKNLLYSLFQWVMVISIPFVVCFYWPNHDERLMKFIAFQILSSVILALSFLFYPKRAIGNIYPALFLILSFVNFLTHGMEDFISVGLGFIVPTITYFYIIANHIHSDFIPNIKKAVVVTCLINCMLFITQLFGLDMIFTIGEHGRACGFMCYPATFAMLCAISLFLTWDWHKWLCFPIVACLMLSHEYSVIGGLILAVSMPLTLRFNKHCWCLISVAMVMALACWHFWPHIHEKLLLRLRYLDPIMRNIWARPLDGWGIGAYRNLPGSFFAHSTRGNWSEMHCEPLDLFFSMGIIGLACVGGWLRLIQERFIWNIYTRSMVVILATSLFHSPFHFADSLYLIIIILALHEAEKHDATY